MVQNGAKETSQQRNQETNERALWEQGIRKPLPKGKNRHEWKAPSWVSQVLQD